MNKVVRHLAGSTLRAFGVKDVNYSVRHRLLQEPYHWTDFPKVIQLDLNNHCGQRYCGVHCVYCRPMSDVQKGIKQYTEMSDEVLDWVLKDVSRYGREMDFICDFLEGDGLDPSLPEKRQRIKKAAPWLKVQTFTCGTRPENAELLCGPELDWINVTLSAHNDVMYRTVHRSTRFNDVLKTMRFLSENRRPSQLLEVHYVINKFNIVYMADWLTLMQSEFPEWLPKFSPLVNTGSDDASNDACGELSTLDQEDAIKKVGGGAFWDRREIGFRKPCVLWDNDDVSANGTLLQCCRWDKLDWSYGLASDFIKNGWSFRDYHMMKVANALRNPFCERCNLKAPDWKVRASKIGVRGVVRP
jgi:pyruvate-formate lyase-activating enzyme